MANELTQKVKAARAECLACHRKGVGFASHPHAFGYKDYSKAVCRYCGKYFKVVGDPFEINELRPV